MAVPRFKQHDTGETSSVPASWKPRTAADDAVAAASPARILQQRLQQAVSPDATLLNEPFVQKWTARRRTAVLLLLAAASWSPFGIAAYAAMRVLR
jgi:hypothetical protein